LYICYCKIVVELPSNAMYLTPQLIVMTFGATKGKQTVSVYVQQAIFKQRKWKCNQTVHVINTIPKTVQVGLFN